jgi:23S rRNA pseudouridine1911/1915/1917 synthase
VNEPAPQPNSRSVIVGTDGDGRRVDVYLACRFPNFSRSRIQKLITGGAVERVDGELKPSSTLSAGQELLVTAPGISPSGPPPPLPAVLHEDERLLVVSKPAGMLAHPAGLIFTYGLVGIARAARPEHEVDLAHRLDRETSGINVLTKDKAANAFLKSAFYDKKPAKTYRAIVHGEPDWDTMEVDAPIGRASGSIIRIRRGIASDGLPAQTTVTVLKRMGDLSLVEARPHTGRTHQIRVHLEHLGLPILGDKMYGQPDSTFTHMLDHGPDAVVREATGFPRHALHAAAITIPHPDGGWVTIEAPLSEDMAAIVDGQQPCWPDPDE